MKQNRLYIALILGLAWAVQSIWLWMYGAVLQEDAAILLRYARHLAAGDGIVWNMGGAAVDGATDFLFMVMVGGLHKLGLGLENSARLLGIFAQGGSIALIYFGSMKLWRTKPLIAGFSAAILLLGPAYAYVFAGFGTPIFAFFVLVAWYYAHLLLQFPAENKQQKWIFSFATFALLAALTRPEGVLLVTMILAMLLIQKRGGERRQIFNIFLLVFGGLGGIYFVWHWIYFSHPLPQPFYKKGGGTFYPQALMQSIENSLWLLMPLIPIFVLGLWMKSKNTLLTLMPIVGFILIWILLSDEMNFMMRFQYVILPMSLLVWPGLLDWEVIYSRIKIVNKLIPIAGILALFYYGFAFRHLPPTSDGQEKMGKMLAQYADQNYGLAVTEAGLLPLYSRWRCLDAWGLNDHKIATNGLSEADLLKFDPAIIMFHAFFSPENPQPTKSKKRFDQKWNAMCLTLYHFAENHDYQLAAAYGYNDQNLHYYYVKSGLPHAAELIQQIQELDYGFGKSYINFAN